MQAIIMAGGEGSRLRPLTCDRPKPMVPLLNRPVMEYALELLKKHGITDIGVTLQYMPEEIRDYFGDGSDFGVRLQYFVEEAPLGTAGSVKNAQSFLTETFVVISGDALTDFDLTRAVEFHRAKKAIGTIVLTSVEVPLEYGVVITGANGEIRRFLEKPSWGEVFSDKVNTGIYILEPDVLDYVPTQQSFDFSKDLFPMLLEHEKPLFGCVLEGYWCDIGDHRQYREAHFDALAGMIDITPAGKLIGENVWAGENCEIHPTARLEGPVVLGRGCFVGPRAEISSTVLGDNSHIAEGASVKKSILWENVHVGKKAELRGTVLCSGSVVKEGACLFEGAVIGERCIIGSYSKIKPDVKIWPHKNVEEGASVSQNLIWGTRGTRVLFGLNGIAGVLNTEITPETAAKIGATFGSVLGPGSQITISSDASAAAKMIKKAFVAGMMSSGANLLNIGVLVTPIHRFALRVAQAGGGVHIREAMDEKDKINLEFFDEKGANLGKAMERKIENLFMREDFRRASSQKIGRATYLPHMVESYLDYLTGTLDADTIREARYRILLAYDTENLLNVIPPLLGRLGCEIVPFNGNYLHGEGWNMNEVMAKRNLLGQVLLSEGAVLGVVLDSNAEKIVFFDENGQMLSDETALGLLAMIIFKCRDRGVVATPVTAPGAIERMAENFGGTVIRTKTSPRDFMEKVLDPKVKDNQGLYSQFFMHFDAVYALARVLEFMARENASLSELVGAIPEFYMAQKDTECPWTDKGRVMRELIEEEKERPVELLDGIKVFHDDGWALVLPHPEKASYRVYSEGFNEEYAQELTDFYIGKINSIRDGVKK